MEEVNQPPQEGLIFENEVDELAISMVELANSQAELFTSQALRKKFNFSSYHVRAWKGE